MTANSLGAMPFVVTLSHTINLDKIKSASDFLDNWYLQLLGDTATGSFNLGTGNTIRAADGKDLTTISSQSPLPLSNLTAKDVKVIYPQLSVSHPEYLDAYSKASVGLGKFFSSANKNILSDQSAFPALWLKDIQNGQLLFASGNPGGKLVNSAGGAPNPIQTSYNYILAELYVGLGPTGNNSNNGDVTYIEQFGLPVSLSLWYTDGAGFLYRGIVDQNGSGLSIPGTSSFLLPDGTTNPDVNNASAFAQALEQDYSQLSQINLKPTDGDLYFNPKAIYSGVSNAIVNPDYGQFYDYFQYLKGLGSGTQPVRWSGQFNQETAYRVSEVTFSGFRSGGSFGSYDQNASIQLSLSYDPYVDGKPPSSLTQTADVVIPWFGIPQTPSLPGVNTAATAANAYSVTNSDRDPQQPSGGWKLEWSPDYQNGQTFSGALVPLASFQGATEVASTGGNYQVAGLYSYYDELFLYDKSGITLTPKSYQWSPTGDVLLSFTPPQNPKKFDDWQSLTLGGDPTSAVLQIKFDGTNWFFQGNSGQLWNNISTGAEFKVPNNGNLPGPFSPTVGLLRAPDAVTGLEDLTFKPDTGVATAAPITSFQVLDTAKGNALVATLTLEDTWQANQLVNPTNFTYAATTAGILGAGAGYYYRTNPKDHTDPPGDYTIQTALQNDLYGTVVGDFLSLINAGLLGATGQFSYNSNPALEIGQLGQLDTGYQVDDGSVVPSPWLDKVNGPVAKDALFGASAWAKQLPHGLLAPYNVWASLVNTYAPSVYGFGLSDRFRNGYDIGFNLEKMDLSTLSDDQRKAIKLQQFIPDAGSAPEGLKPTDADQIFRKGQEALYPIFAEYQIGGFGASPFDFLPSYVSNTPTPAPAPTPTPIPTPTPDSSNEASFKLLDNTNQALDFGVVIADPGLVISSASVLQVRGQQSVTVTTPAGDKPVALPIKVDELLDGYISYQVSGLAPGGSTVVSFRLPSGLAAAGINGNALVKFNYQTGQFQQYLDVDGTPLYQLRDTNGDGVIDAIDITLRDGDPRWDGDGLVNGSVTDPAGYISGAAEFEAVKLRGRAKKERQIVEGNLLANRITGSKTKDLIIGGLGADVMDGRRGRDIYFWNDAAESGVLPGTRDVITEFRHGKRNRPKDQLDLRALGPGLNFIGADGFSAVAGQVRFDAGLLEVDLNGNGLSDFSVELQRRGDPVARFFASNLLL